MPKRTVGVALWEYRNKDGKRRLGYLGEELDLSTAESKRGDARGVFVKPEAGRKAASGKAGKPAVDESPDEGDDILEGLDGEEPASDTPVEAVEDSSNEETPEVAAAEQSEDDGEVARPNKTAPHADWIAFAVAQGMDADEATATSRADLIKALA